MTCFRFCPHHAGARAFAAGALLWLLAGVGTAVAAEPPTAALVRDMSLSEAVALSVRHNRTIRSAYLQRIVDKFALRVAYDEFRPNLTLGASAGRSSSFETSTDTRADVDSAGLNAAIDLKVPTGGQFAFLWELAESQGDVSGDPASGNVSLSFSQPLLRGAGLDVNRASQRIAERTEATGQLQLKSVLMTTVTSAIQAYRNLVQANRQLEIARLSLERSRNLLAVNQALVEAGRMAEVDVVQTEADVASRALSLQIAENAANSARLELIKVLDLDTRLRIEPVEPLTAKPVSMDPERLIELAFANRPDYLQTLYQLENAQAELMLSQNNRLWDLQLSASYGLSGSSANVSGAATQLGRGGEGDYSLGLNLTVPIGDIARSQRLVNAEVQVEQVQLAVEELRDNVEVEVRNAARDVQIRFQQVQLAQRARELAERKLEIEREKLAAGRSSNFQLLAYQSDLASLQNSELDAVIGYQNSLTVLDSLVGTTLETWGISIEEPL